MNIEPYTSVNRVFRLRDGRGAKFFMKHPSFPDYPITLMCDGELLNYNSLGHFLGRKNDILNVQEVMPLVCWSVDLSRCRIGQRLFIRNYTLAVLDDVVPGTLGSTFVIKHPDGRLTQHNKNGWGINRDSEPTEDVMGYFEEVDGAPAENRTHLKSIRGLLERLEISFSLQDKSARQKEFNRVLQGTQLLLAKIATEFKT